MTSVCNITSTYEDHYEIKCDQSLYISTVLQLVFPNLTLPLTGNEGTIHSNVGNLLYCPWCSSVSTAIHRTGERTRTRHVYCCSSLYCYKCHAKWYICSDCSASEIYPLLHGKGGNSRTACHMRKKKFDEHIAWHRENAAISQNAAAEQICEEDRLNDVTDEFLIGNDCDDNTSGSEIAFDRRGCVINNIRCIFDNAETCHIGEFMIHEFSGLASKHIIQESIMGSSLCSSSKDISSNDSLLFMLLLSLGSRMSREERNKLGMMLALIQRKVEEETLISQGLLSACHVHVPLPTSSYDMRKIFENGKQQFTNYMPLPTIVSPIPGYASVSLIKAVQILYSRGEGWDNHALVQENNDPSDETKRSILVGRLASDLMNTIINNIPDADKESTILQPIVLWSDSADLNKVKNNRSSIKVHNIYVAHKNGQSQQCVFPLAIGSGKSAHETYRGRMFEDFNTLHEASVPCFDSCSNRNSLVRFFLLAIVQDRPEHSEFTGTIAHNGKYGVLPGYSFPRSICVGSLPGVTILKHLVSCRECYNRRIHILCRRGQEDLPVHDDCGMCDKCYDWDVTRVQFRIPSKMPKDIPLHCFAGNDASNDIMVSKAVSFQSIKDALQYIHDKTYRKEWTDYAKTVQSFASYECVNTSLAKKVYDKAKELRKQHIREEGNVRDGGTPVNEHLLPKALLCPNLTLGQCMVGIMHTFFLNGGKKFLTLLYDVFKKEKMGMWFLTKSKIYFRDLRALSLSWIMAWPFGSTNDKPMAPWVSENFVAYYQVSKSHISIVCERLILGGRKNIADSLKLLVSIWHRLLSVVMQPVSPSHVDIWMVGELAKLFLSRYHEMEKYIGRSTKDWDLQNASCHLMLLLLPDYMSRFGCLRNYWEGGHMGERSIIKLKKSLPHGAHMDGSVRTAIRRYFIDVVLSQLMDREHSVEKLNSNIVQYMEGEKDLALDEEDCPYENIPNNNENCTASSYDRYRRFRAYKSFQSFRMAIADTRPAAIVFLPRTNSFYAIVWQSVSNNRLRVMHEVNLSGGSIIEGTYMVDKESLINSLGNDDDIMEDAEDKVVFNSSVAGETTACAALPYHTVGYDGDHQVVRKHHYFIRTENHLELRKVSNDGNHTFSYPTLYTNKGQRSRRNR